jgi:hypothetical protein
MPDRTQNGFLFDSSGALKVASVSPDGLTTGEEVFDRRFAIGNVPLTSTSMRLAFFTARKTESISQVRFWSGSTAAAATPTLIRVGVFTEAADGSIALLASTVNDTTLLAAVNASNTKSFSSTWTKTAGQRYGVGILVVSATTMPTFLGVLGNGGDNFQPPKLSALVTGQSDLPASVALGSMTATANCPFFSLLP